MTYASTNKKKKLLTTIPRLPLCIFAFTGLLVVVYMYGIGSLTHNVIARKDIQKEIKETTSRISVLEEEYINTLETINKDLALSSGYEEPRTLSYSTTMTFADARGLAYEI